MGLPLTTILGSPDPRLCTQPQAPCRNVNLTSARVALPRFCGLEVGGKETPIFDRRGSSVSHLLPLMPLEASLHHWALKAPLEAL